MLLRPTLAGTEVSPASAHQEIRDLLEGGLPLANAVMPHSRPADAVQLALFGES
ncbi:MAG: hypothetical protein ACNA8N_01260 [Trueperaceae bacterium]